MRIHNKEVYPSDKIDRDPLRFLVASKRSQLCVKKRIIGTSQDVESLEEQTCKGVELREY